jgi:hypothetical protein
MYTIDFAHYDYLQYLSELGALAFLAGLMFVLGVFRQAIRAGMEEPSTDRRYVALACTGSFVAISLHSFVDFNLHRSEPRQLLDRKSPGPRSPCVSPSELVDSTVSNCSFGEIRLPGPMPPFRLPLSRHREQGHAPKNRHRLQQ